MLTHERFLQNIVAHKITVLSFNDTMVCLRYRADYVYMHMFALIINTTLQKLLLTSIADSSCKAGRTRAAEAIDDIRAGASVLTGIGRTVIGI